jgi:hypothetical protein
MTSKALRLLVITAFVLVAPSAFAGGGHGGHYGHGYAPARARIYYAPRAYYAPVYRPYYPAYYPADPYWYAASYVAYAPYPVYPAYAFRPYPVHRARPTVVISAHIGVH